MLRSGVLPRRCNFTRKQIFHRGLNHAAVHRLINIAPAFQNLSAGCPPWVRRQNSGPFLTHRHLSTVLRRRTCGGDLAQTHPCQCAAFSLRGRAVITRSSASCNFVMTASWSLQQPSIFQVVRFQNLRGLPEWSVPGRLNASLVHHRIIAGKWCSPIHPQQDISGWQGNLCRPDSFILSSCVRISGAKSAWTGFRLSS